MRCTATFETNGPDRWLDVYDLGNGDKIIRAHLHHQAANLVVETSSTERADRITDQLVDGHPELKIVAIQRTPFDPTVPAGPTSPPDTATGGMVPDDVLDQIRHQIEQRWCHEYIPALNGLTPHEAAADPVAREILTRLIDSFDQFPAPSGAVVMRPVQLRNILGLTEGT